MLALWLLTYWLQLQEGVNVFHGAFLKATWNKLTIHAKQVDSEEELNLSGVC